MKPEARLSAAAELLDDIARTGAPAEFALKRWGGAHRYAGSADRRAIADRVYRCLRARARLAWAMGGESGRALVIGSLALIDGLEVGQIAALFSGQAYGPTPLTPEELGRLTAPAGEPPAWVAAGLPEFVSADLRQRLGPDWVDEASALMLPRAPIDLRVNGLIAQVDSVQAELASEGLSAELTPHSAWGLRLASEPPPNLQKLAAFRDGRFEVQDESSQIAAWLSGAAPGMTIVDYCAGGGGKTLALGQMLGGAGRLIASDIDPKRLEAIRPRLARAGMAAELRRLGEAGEGMEDLVGAADLVFVDAPCSGSGAWRRRPEDAWRLTQAEVERLHQLQVEVLTRAARLVSPRGRLVYVTCSVLTRENEDSAAAFEAAHEQFRPVPIAQALDSPGLTAAGKSRLAEFASGHQLRLSPRRTGADGFFVSTYERM